MPHGLPAPVGMTGLPVPPRAAAALPTAMATLVANSAMRAACGQAGLARQQAVFSVQSFASRVAASLDEAANVTPSNV